MSATRTAENRISASPPPRSGNADSTPSTDPLPFIREAIQGIRHGIVQVIIQDGVVVQIDRTEKQRLR